MTKGVSFRRGTAADAHKAWEVRTVGVLNLCASRYPPNLIERWAAVPVHQDFGLVLAQEPSYVAETKTDNGETRLIGWGLLRPPLDGNDHEKTARIEGIFVCPDWTRRGIASGLLARLHETAGGLGCSWLSLDATLNAVGFYRRCGFSVQGDATWSHPSGFSLIAFA